MQQAGMRQDHSWAASARRYVEVYERAMASREEVEGAEHGIGKCEDLYRQQLRRGDEAGRGSGRLLGGMVRTLPRIAPIVEQLATEYAGRATIGKMNVDENPNVPTSRFHVRGIPTLVVLKNGQLVDTIVGLVPKEDIVSTSSAISDEAMSHAIARSSSSVPGPPD